MCRHFLKFEKIIRGRSQDRGEMQAALRQGKWWVIFAARRDVNFEGPKIVSPQRSYENTFAFNDSPWYASADVYYITPKDPSIDLKYVLAHLNSKLIFYGSISRESAKEKCWNSIKSPCLRCLSK